LICIQQRGGNWDELYELCAVAKIFTAFISAVLQYCNVLREVKPKLELIANVEDELVQVISFLETIYITSKARHLITLYSRGKSQSSSWKALNK
jgi:hypothetical protein